VRIVASSLLLLFALAGCGNRAAKNNEQIRQAVIDHLAGRNLNIAPMDINISSVQYTGDKADATVVFTPKGGTAAQGMTLHYEMGQKNGHWEVVRTADSGHAGSVQPGTANPHDAAPGAAPSGSPHGAMPSPEDLPPAGKK